MNTRYQVHYMRVHTTEDNDKDSTGVFAFHLTSARTERVAKITIQTRWRRTQSNDYVR